VGKTTKAYKYAFVMITCRSQ